MMKNYDMKSYQKKLKREMDEGRYQHTLGVMYTSAALAMRYEYDIQKAQMARGADFESGNLIERAKAMIPLLVPLFVSSFRRANELAMAMEARCYRGGDGRTRLKVLRCTRQDYIDLAVCLACFAVILASRLVFPNF